MDVSVGRRETKEVRDILETELADDPEGTPVILRSCIWGWGPGQIQERMIEVALHSYKAQNEGCPRPGFDHPLQI